MPDSIDTDRRNAMLTRKDREFLLSDGSGYSADNKYDRKVSITERARQTLADFRLLADHFPEEWEDEIFHSLPFTEEYNQLDTDITKTIEFLYVGLGGQAKFRRPLMLGTSRGEVELGNVEYPSQAIPRFVVHRSQLSVNEREAVELVENANWNALESPDLFTFIRTAYFADAIDFEAVKQEVDRYDDLDVREHLRHFDETTEFGKQMMQEALQSLAIVEEHRDDLLAVSNHYEEFQEWREEREEQSD